MPSRKIEIRRTHLAANQVGAAMGNDKPWKNGQLTPFCILYIFTRLRHGTAFFFFFFCYGVAQTLGDAFVMTLEEKKKKIHRWEMNVVI